MTVSRLNYKDGIAYCDMGHALTSKNKVESGKCLRCEYQERENLENWRMPGHEDFGSFARPRNGFWSRVNIGDVLDCWIWCGAFTTGDYGTYKGGLAHRTAYALVRGGVPKGARVYHLCKVSACVNPHHLEAR